MSYYKSSHMLSANTDHFFGDIFGPLKSGPLLQTSPAHLCLCASSSTEANHDSSNYSVNGSKQGLVNMLHAVLLI